MPEKVNNSNTLVAYLDLLGYAKLVEEASEPERYYKIINDELNIFDRFMDADGVEPAQRKSAEITRKYFSLNVWSDSFFITLDQEGLCKEEGVSKEVVIWRFLAIISALTQRIFCSTQLLLRGSIIQGQYYQQRFDGFGRSDFIYSKALCEAVYLEENIVDTSRIIIDQKLAQEFINYRTAFYFNKSYHSQLLQDLDGLFYLNIYWWVIHIKEKRIDMLIEAKNILEDNIKNYRHNLPIVRKWIWFANYHNEMISRLQSSGDEGDNTGLLHFYKVDLEGILR